MFGPVTSSVNVIPLVWMECKDLEKSFPLNRYHFDELYGF